MKVYYSQKGVRIFNGDVIEVLNTLPEESIDLIFADPMHLPIKPKEHLKF